MKRLWVLFAALFAVFAPAEGFAQIEPPKVSASLQPRDVEVGEPFSVTLTVTVDSSAPSPSDPVLPLPDGLRTGPPSVSNQTQFSIVNGHMSHKSGITATWQIVATREGAFGIGPPSVTWNGRKVQANGMRVVVHPASPGGRQRHAAPSPQPFDPFGMFPKLPGIFDAPEPSPQAEPAPDPELALDSPLDPKVFLRSVVDQKNLVVGEQVTLTIYIYARSMGLELTDLHEPSIPDFYRRDLLSPHNQPEPRPVSIGGVIWSAQPIYKVALFPLKSGEVEIGPMQATIVGRGSGLNAVRASQPIKLHVGEPPGKGRPVGYQIGDVGNYTLTATVEPRKSEVGGAVAVTLKLSGVGNVPNAIKVPTSSAVEWLEPQVREDIEVENGKVRGSRTFSYVARPKTAGTVELGEATLSYWNPDRKVYDIARAYLGKIDVLPDATKPASGDPAAPRDPWASLGKERDRPGGYKRPPEPLTERPFYWLGLLGAPFAVVASSLGSRGVRRLRARFAARRRSAERGIDQALTEARGAAKADNRSAALGPLERALYLAIERVTGLKARALLIDDVPAALEERGVDAEVAAEIKGVLSSIEAARFVPDDPGGAAPSARGLFERAEGVVRKLGRMALVVVLITGFAGRGTAAAEDKPEALFQRGVSALRDGSLNEAVEIFEALADRGFVDPDASFNRSLSYLGRVRGGVERPGDLGRAAAALEEALLLRSDDREAESALDLVRAEVARRRARGGATTDVESRPTLERAVVGIASEWTWSVLAALSSLFLTIGLALRVIASARDDAALGEERTTPPAREGTLHLASAIIIPLGCVGLLAFALLAVGARQLRLTTREGVVVIPEAHLVTEKGVLTSKGPIPEAARVELGEQRGALVHVRWGAIEGWTQSDAVRRLARP